MIHNNGVYGQNEVPVNCSSTINGPQLGTPVGALNNLSKYLETGESSSNFHQQYNNNVHNALHNTQYSPYGHNLPYNMSPAVNTVMGSIYNNMSEISNTPMNLNINNTFYTPSKQYSKKNNIDLSNFYYRKPPQLENNISAEKSEEVIKNDSKSDENILNLNTKVESDSKLNNNVHRKIRKRKKSAKVEKKINLEVMDVKPQEPLPEPEVKEEEVLDLDFNPFVKDIHGISRDDLELSNYSIYGVEDAKKIIDGETEFDFGTVAFNCDQCSLIFLHPKRYLIHMKWHTFGMGKDKKNKKREFRGRPKKEIILGNISDDLYCRQCNKTFATSNGLFLHNDKYHLRGPKECNVCHKEFPTYKILVKHKKSMHVEVTSYNCPVCPKTFKFPRSLQKHQDTHLEKTHGCNECDKKFGSQLLLHIHSKTHERSGKERAYHCTYCGKGYYDSYAVAAHERTHTNERPFECDICHTTFGTTSGVKRHKRVSHNTNKPYECPTCHRSFSTALIRDRHQVRYHDAPELLVYPCSQCPSRFMSMKELTKHCKLDHNVSGAKTKRKRSVEYNDSE